MKKIIMLLLIAAMCCGCVAIKEEDRTPMGTPPMPWSYLDAIKQIDCEYFKTKIVIDGGPTAIVQNEVTGEYFLVIAGGSGITVTPIKVEE